MQVEALIEVGTDHRLADPEPLEAMLKAWRMRISLPPLRSPIRV
jgi:hypothetical protein